MHAYIKRYSGECDRHDGKGGRVQHRSQQSGHDKEGCAQQQHVKTAPLEITEDEIIPLKLYVGKLRHNINKYQLLEALTIHANVTSAFIVKKTRNLYNYAVISLSTENDVKQIMDLNNKDYTLAGLKLEFKPAHRHFIPPGEEGFVHQKHFYKDYDLKTLVPNKPSIHILVDDVMIKILKYLPLKEIKKYEIVCRRWKALLYIIFKNTTHMILNDNEDNLSLSVKNSNFQIQNKLYVSISMFLKMLFITGENIKYLNLFELSDSASKNYIMKNIFSLIAQLCPNLECLDMPTVPFVYFYENIKGLKDCNNLKCFSAKQCFELLNEKCFKELVSALRLLPCLEKICVSHSDIQGSCFNLLPEGLKELNVSFCKQISKNNFHKLSKVCTNLEVLEIEKLDAGEAFLEELGITCTNIRVLKLYPSFSDVSHQIKVFTNLTCLKVVAYRFELSNIADNVIGLQELHIKIMKATTNLVDFGKFTQLKDVFIISSPFRKKELMSLINCKNLQYVTIAHCDEVDQETIKNIVKACPDIKHIGCDIDIDIKFIIYINQIMKHRLQPMKILTHVGGSAYTNEESLKTHYDTNKIDLDFAGTSFFGEYFDEDYDFVSESDSDEDDDFLYESDSDEDYDFDIMGNLLLN